MTLNQKIKLICSANKIPVTRLEEALGFARGSIGKWDESTPSVTKVIKVANALGLSLEKLLEGVKFED